VPITPFEMPSLNTDPAPSSAIAADVAPSQDLDVVDEVYDACIILNFSV
jgi:hypothetical protein